MPYWSTPTQQNLKRCNRVVYFSCLRASESSLIWVNSSLLLETLSVKEMLGRVLAVEYASYTIFEAFAATVAGRLQDTGYSKDQIALSAPCFGFIVTGLWSVHHYLGQGAALP